jgi:predicted Zn-ribbon and HTH transcriptional regulator
MASTEDIIINKDLANTYLENAVKHIQNNVANKDFECNIIYQDCNKSGYDFFENQYKLPGEICSEIFEFSRQFKENEWYNHEQIYDLSEGILHNIWLDPDNPNSVIYIQFTEYDFYRNRREIIQVYINEVRYIGKELSILNFLRKSNEKNNNGSNELNDKSYEEIIEKENMIFRSPFTCTELDERFIYSRLFLGYDYETIINNYGAKTFKLLPVRNKVLSLKNLSIRNIRLFIAEQLDLIKEINKSEIILKPLTLRCNGNCVRYRKWEPSLIQYLDEFIKDQPLFIKEMLDLRKIPL